MKEMADKTGDNSALKPTNVVEINENAAGDLCENTDDKVELGIMKSASTSRFKVAKVSDAGEPSVNTNADTEAAQAHDKIPKRRNNSEHVEFNLDENKKNTDVYPESPPGSPMFYTDTTSPNDTYGYGNSFTNNHTNSKTFGKNITEALPHVDHYRNLLSATAALKSRPTLAELHEEKVRSYWSTIAQLELKGVGEGGQRGLVPPHFQKWGGAQVGLCPPTFGQIKCSNFAISSFFKVRNAKFSWLASLANFTLFISSELSLLKTLE